MIIGVHENMSVMATKGRFPGVTATGPAFLGQTKPTDLVAKITKTLDSYKAPVQYAFLTFKAPPADVIAGKYDAAFRNLGTNLYTRPFAKVYIAYWHEPEDDLQPSTFTKALARFHQVTHETSGDRFASVYSALAYAWRPTDHRTADPHAWQPRYVDVFAADVYSGKSFSDTATLPEHAGWKRWQDQLVMGGNWGLTERGFQGPHRAATIAFETTWLMNQVRKPRFYLVWNTPGTENDPNWVLDAPGEVAVRRLIDRCKGL